MNDSDSDDLVFEPSAVAPIAEALVSKRKKKLPKVGPRSKDALDISSDDDLVATRMAPVGSSSPSGSVLPLADNDGSECSSVSGVFEVPVAKAGSSSRRVARGTTSSKSARKPAKGKVKANHYVPLEDEEVEHEGLEVINESMPDDSSAETSDDLPCRTLDDFV
ncbi:hypothetical protein GGF38_005983, partial [Coemansia sp. RSA 25]